MSLTANWISHGLQELKDEPEGKLYQWWVVARGYDPSEISWIPYLSSIRIEIRHRRNVQVTDRVRKVHMIEHVEELCPELNSRWLLQRKALRDV